MSADPPELHEDVELDLDTRRYLLDLFAGIGRLDHYEVLGLPRGADKKTVKRTYFRLAGILHPDRYFTKRLGSYKAKMEAVFARATMAFEVLSAPGPRAKYDAALGAAPAAAAGPAAKAASPVDPRIAAQRAAMLAEFQKLFAENETKAKAHADAAVRARARGDVAAAIECYELALVYAPRNAALLAAHAELTKASAGRLGDSHEKQALLEERFGQWAEAVRSWQEVVKARPTDEKARERLENAKTRARG